MTSGPDRRDCAPLLTRGYRRHAGGFVGRQWRAAPGSTVTPVYLSVAASPPLPADQRVEAG
jgi:hypothetical protein